jgi:hypothetical protein
MATGKGKPWTTCPHMAVLRQVILKISLDFLVRHLCVGSCGSAIAK